MGLISEDSIRLKAVTALARALRKGIVFNQSAWVWRWLDSNGVEVRDPRKFTRVVIRRARAAVPNWDLLCTGIGPDPDRRRS